MYCIDINPERGSARRGKVSTAIAALGVTLALAGAAGPLASPASAVQWYGCGTTCQTATGTQFETCDAGQTNLDGKSCLDAGLGKTGTTAPLNPIAGIPTAPQPISIGPVTH
jgi:hypothetical protein